MPLFSFILSISLGSRAVESWYSEISSYNFSSPGYSSSVGHFTQLVWQNSIQLGIGISYNSNNTRAVVVANYYPQGNIIGSFATNVPQVCTSTTTVATSTSTSTVSNSSAINAVQIHIPVIVMVSTFTWWFN